MRVEGSNPGLDSESSVLTTRLPCFPYTPVNNAYVCYLVLVFVTSVISYRCLCRLIINVLERSLHRDVAKRWLNENLNQAEISLAS